MVMFVKQKVFPTDEEKRKRAHNFDEVVANSALEGYRSPTFESYREAYINGYLTAEDIDKMPLPHIVMK